MTAAVAASLRSSVFEVAFLDAGRERRESLTTCWNWPFASVAPVRGFSSYRGQSKLSWVVVVRHHWGARRVESWLERDHVMLLDFDADVVGLAAQPFWLRWRAASGWRRHAPDLFARLVDGTGVVVDVRADERVDEAAAAAAGSDERPAGVGSGAGVNAARSVLVNTDAAIVSALCSA